MTNQGAMRSATSEQGDYDLEGKGFEKLRYLFIQRIQKGKYLAQNQPIGVYAFLCRYFFIIKQSYTQGRMVCNDFFFGVVVYVGKPVFWRRWVSA